jgi:hypothetical protein
MVVFFDDCAGLGSLQQGFEACDDGLRISRQSGAPLGEGLLPPGSQPGLLRFRVDVGSTGVGFQDFDGRGWVFNPARFRKLAECIKAPTV